MAGLGRPGGAWAPLPSPPDAHEDNADVDDDQNQFLHESADGIMIWSRRRLNMGVAVAKEKLNMKNVQHCKTKTIVKKTLIVF